MFFSSQIDFPQSNKTNLFLSWPGLNSPLITKHLVSLILTLMGHIKQEQQGLCFTKYSIPNKPLQKTQNTIFSSINTSIKTYMDLTGRFPYKSSRSNECILIAYHIDSNAILGQAIKKRLALTITNAWKQFYSIINHTSATPNSWILDNEISHYLQHAIRKNSISFQLVSPHNHRSNLIERAIQTFKNYLKTGLGTVHPQFPIAEWDILLHQAFITLDLLHTANTNPNLSGHSYFFSNFDFNRTSLAPPGSKVVIHQKPSQCVSWDLNGTIGFYIGPALHHYSCMMCYVPSTKSEIISNTLHFIPHTIPILTVTIDPF